MALGAGSRTTAANTVSVGSADNRRRITNVAPGTARSDAATFGQLQDSEARLCHDMAADRKEARQGIAAAMAMTAAAMPSEPGRTSWTANAATFRSEVAFGASLAHRIDTALPFAITAGYSYGGDDSHGARLGLAGEF